MTDRWGSLAEKFRDYCVVLEPDENAPDWWAGAPSVVRDPADGTFWMAARMREAHSPRGQRGYEIRILRSRDGIHFKQVHSLRREEVPLRGFERPCLFRDPRTGRYRLYGCGTFEGEGPRPWVVIQFDDADTPTGFDPKTCRVVIQPDVTPRDPAGGFRHFKDPFVVCEQGVYHMFLIGADVVERACHFLSDDGNHWRPADPLIAFDLGGWHTFATRPACILPLPSGYLMVYEGSHPGWYDPVYNIATGLAFSGNLNTFTDLTPDGPLLVSTTPGDYVTWRYSHWLEVGSQCYVYAEVSRPNNSNELRLVKLDKTDLISGCSWPR